MDVPEGCLSVERIESIGCVDKEHCFRLRGLKHLTHGVYGSLASSQMPCADLERAGSTLDVVADSNCNCSAYDPSDRLTDAEMLRLEC